MRVVLTEGHGPWSPWVVATFRDPVQIAPAGVVGIASLPFARWGGPSPMALAASSGRWAERVGLVLGTRLRRQGYAAAVLPTLDPVQLRGPLDGISDNAILTGRVAVGLARGVRAAGLRVFARYRTECPAILPCCLSDWEREEAPALQQVLPEVDGIWLGRVPLGPVGSAAVASCAVSIGILRGCFSFGGIILSDLRGVAPDALANVLQATQAAGADLVLLDRDVSEWHFCTNGDIPWPHPLPIAPASVPSEEEVAASVAASALTLVRDRGFLSGGPLTIRAMADGATVGLAAALGGSGGRVVALLDDAWNDADQVVRVRELITAYGADQVGVLAVGNPGDVALVPEAAFAAVVYDASSATVQALRNALSAPDGGRWPGRLPVELGRQIALSGRSLPWMTTEQPNPATTGLDAQSTRSVVDALLQAEARVVPAVMAEEAAIVAGVEWIVDAIAEGHRVFYAGAGSAGRLGVLDASEIPPTYGMPAHRFRALMAGGDAAIRTALEGVEDAAHQAATDLEAEGIGPGDVLIAVAASGRTPYALEAARTARSHGAIVIAVVNNRNTPLHSLADTVIAPLTGPEAVAGSTRLSAGSAEKVVLNCLSTAAMVRLGRVRDNLMVDFRPTNAKLVERAERVVMWVTGCAWRVAHQALRASEQDIRQASAQIMALQETPSGRAGE